MKARRRQIGFLTLVLLLLFSLPSFVEVTTASWLTGWNYRKSHVINAATGAGTNYQIRITVHKGSGADSGEHVYLGANVRDDFGDVRFTSSDGSTLLDYWTESYTSGSQAVFWVKVADDLSTNPATIYVYYGKSDATTTSNGANTFIFFENFEGTFTWTYEEYNDPSDSMGGWVVSGTYTSPTQSYRIYKSQNIGAGPNTYGRIKKTINFSGIQVKIEFQRRNTGTTDGNNQFARKAWLDDAEIENSDIYWETKDIWVLSGITQTPSAGNHDLKLGLYVITYQTGKWAFIWWDDVKIRKYVSPEPSHGAWGTEEMLNSAPTIGEFNAPSTVYANKYFLLNATINDADGLSEFVNATIELSNSIILMWVNSTNTFSKQQDTYGYCTLDASGSLRTQLNSTAYRLSWKIKLSWSFPEGSVNIVATNTKVFDDDGASGSGSQTGLFTFEDDLIVYSASVDDSVVNPSQSLTFSGTLYYEGTTTAPEDTSGITAKVELSGTLKGSTATINADGTFSIPSVTAESSVNSYSYNVFAVTDQNSVQNQTVSVTVDRLKIVLKGANDTRVDINAGARVYFNVTREYDAALFNSSKGTVYINSTAATWDATSKYWYLDVSQSTVGYRNYTVSSITDSEYGISTLNDAVGAEKVGWDKAEFIVSVSDSHINKGENATITVSGTYTLDGASFSGTQTLNDTTTQYSTDGKRGYKVASITDGLYGLTVFTTNEVYVIWDSLKCDSNSIDMGSVKVYVHMKYGYDDSVVSGGTVSLAGRSAATNSSGWAEFDMTSGSDFSWSQTAYGTADSSYGITCKAQNQTLPIAKKTRFVESDMEISQLSWEGVKLTVQLTGTTGSYTLKVSGPRPTYIKGTDYDLSTDYASYLSLLHDGSRDIVVSYLTWGDFYTRSLDQGWITDIYWTEQKLTLMLNGTSGTSGTLTVYCGSRGIPTSTSGFSATPEYSTATKVLSGQYQFSSEVTLTLGWTVSSPTGGGESTATYVTFVAAAVKVGSVPQGQTVNAALNMSWMGVNQVTITRITFTGDGSDWLTLAEVLPKTLTKEIGGMTGAGIVTIRLNAPANAKPGDYTVPVRVEAEAIGNRFETSSSLSFRIVEPTIAGGGVSEIMTYLFAALIIVAIAAAYLKRG